MEKQNNIHNYFNLKQLKLPLQLEIKIPFDSEIRTFDEVLRRLVYNVKKDFHLTII